MNGAIKAERQAASGRVKIDSVQRRFWYKQVVLKLTFYICISAIVWSHVITDSKFRMVGIAKTQSHSRSGIKLFVRPQINMVNEF